MARDYLGSVDRLQRRIHGQHPELSARAARDWAVRIAERNAAEKREGRHAPVNPQPADIGDGEAARELRNEFGIELSTRQREVEVVNGDLRPVPGSERKE